MFIYPVNETIQLQLLTLKDADAVFQLTDHSRQYLREWLPWVDSTKSVEDTRRFIQFSLNQFAANNGFQAGVRYQGELVGCLGLHGIDWTHRLTSLGYWLGEPYQGRGIMTAAVRAAVTIAFQEYQLNRVEIRAAVGNRKSRAIAERLGFLAEGCVRQAEWLGDRYVDHIVYGMLREEWPPDLTRERF
ncbi:MAG: GNAT family protein [Firmicutes bacterium]|nr:GNAT family protein [Bacillota bacterium]